MDEPFIGEVRMVGFSFAPRGWALCDGQLLPISQNTSLYSILGTTYGGDGKTTFALPDLRGRAPIHVAGGHPLGQRSGSEKHTLTVQEIPSHHHGVHASADGGDQNAPGDHILAKPTIGLSAHDIYGDPSNLESMKSSAVSDAGGSGAHDNMQPYTTINFIIALQGLFPSRS